MHQDALVVRLYTCTYTHILTHYHLYIYTHSHTHTNRVIAALMHQNDCLIFHSLARSRVHRHTLSHEYF